jgi:hypothetical protein
MVAPNVSIDTSNKRCSTPCLKINQTKFGWSPWIWHGNHFQGDIVTPKRQVPKNISGMIVWWCFPHNFQVSKVFSASLAGGLLYFNDFWTNPNNYFTFCRYIRSLAGYEFHNFVSSLHRTWLSMVIPYFWPNGGFRGFQPLKNTFFWRKPQVGCTKIVRGLQCLQRPKTMHDSVGWLEGSVMTRNVVCHGSTSD